MGKRIAVIRPTPEEEEAINRGIALDPDNPEWTAEDTAAARRGIEVHPELSAAQRAGRLRGPQKCKPVKSQITLRLDPDLIERLRASGRGWQGKINDAVREYLDRPTI